ncbi:hypothetical protein [Macrococcus animalis]|uniref:hypothetical protein n=1 Tax=Macrococcus animalis TaxID=3395467 RepID=UPI0039BDADEE
MIDAITFYFKTMFDTKLSIDLKRYKQQSWISFFILIIIMVIGFYIIKDEPDIYNEAFYKLTEEKRNAIELKSKTPFIWFLSIGFLLFKLSELPNEIHRANRTKINWKIHLFFMVALFLIYFALLAWQYYTNNPDFIMSSYIIILFTGFCFDKNNRPTDEEKLLEEAKKYDRNNK